MAFITVKVYPRSKFPGVEKAEDGIYRIRVVSPPEKGRANREVLDRLAGHLGIPLSSLKIVRGMSSSRKTIRIG